MFLTRSEYGIFLCLLYGTGRVLILAFRSRSEYILPRGTFVPRCAMDYVGVERVIS